MFECGKEVEVEEDVNEILSEMLINMLLSIVFQHAQLRDYEVSDKQEFELYQFIKNDMKILGLEHLTEKAYTKIEMRNDIVVLPYPTMKIAIVDTGTVIQMRFIEKEIR